MDGYNGITKIDENENEWKKHWYIVYIDRFFFCCSNQKRKKPFFDIIRVIFSGKKYILNSWDFQYRKKILAIFPRKLIFFSFDILKIFSFFFWLSFEVWKMIFQKNEIRLKSIKKKWNEGIFNVYFHPIWF